MHLFPFSSPLRSKRGQKIHILSTFHAPLAHYWKGICMKLKMVQSITLHTLCICYTHCGKNQLFVYYFKSNYWNFFIDVQNTDIPEIKRFLKIESRLFGHHRTFGSVCKYNKVRELSNPH